MQKQQNNKKSRAIYKSVEKALQESEEKFRTIAERNFDAIYELDLRGRITYVSAAVERITGYRPDELLGEFIQSFVPESEMDKAAEKLADVARGENLEGLQVNIMRKDGSLASIEFNASPIFRDGKIVGSQGVARDITQRKRAEEALREGEKKYRQLVENLIEVIYAVDQEGIVTYVSPTVESITGYTPSEVVGRNLTDFVCQEDLHDFLKSFQEVLSGQSVSNEYRIFTKSGEIHWVYTSSRPIFAGNRVAGVQGVLADITERKKAEEALRTSEIKFRGLFENVLEGIYQTTPDGKIISANPALVKMLGYESEEELRDLDIADDLYVDPHQRKTVTKRLEEEGRLRNVELVLKTRDGQPITVLENTRVVFDEKGTVLYYEGTLTDITELKQKEEELLESERKYRTLVEQSLQGLVIVQGMPPQLVFVNSALARMLGHTVRELQSLSTEEVTALIHPDDQTLFTEGYQARLKGEERHLYFEVRAIRKDGSVRWLEVSSTWIEYLGKPAVQATFIDITERKHAEMQLKKLFEASKLINSTMNIERVYKFVSDTIQELIGFDNFMIFLISDDKTQLYPAYVPQEFEDRIEDMILDYGEGLIGYSVENRETLILGNAHKDKRTKEIPGVTKRFTSQIVSPLIVEDECVGAIHISKTEENAYDSSSVGFLKPLIEVISSAIRHSKLYNEITKLNLELETRIDERSRRIEILLDTRQKLQGEGGWEDGLITIVESVSNLGFERCGVFLVNPRKETLDFHYGVGVELPEKSRSIPLEETDYFGVKCVLEKNAVHVREFNPDEGKQITSESGSFVWVPIIVQDEVFAAISADSVESGKMVTDEDVKDLKILAGMCAAFIDRTRMFVEPIPEKSLKTELRYWLDPSECYIVLEKKPEKSFEMFVDLTTHGIPGFVVSRIYPEKLKRKYNLVRTPLLWLSRIEMENALNPNDLSKLNYIIGDFTRRSKESVILLDGVEYLITQTSLETVLKYLYELRDIVALHNSRLIVPFHKATLSEREYSIFEKEFVILQFS